MIDLSLARLSRLSITWVGNKSRYEGVGIPRQTLVPVHDVAAEMLTAALLKPFEKTGEYFYFHHEEDVSHHPVFQVCHEVFADPEVLSEGAARLAQQLYEHCELPKVQGGEFFVAHFDDVILEGETVQAIALWKVQEKTPFFKTDRSEESFRLNVLEGIALGKPETAALVFAVDETEGYRVCAVDTVSKKDDRSFWKDSFLRLRPIEDDYFNTRHYISMTGEFIHQKMPETAERTEQLDLLYRSGLFFKENEHFDVQAFAENMFEAPEQQQAFLDYRDTYAKAYAVPLDDTFDINPQAVRKGFKVLKSVIKLDKNFHIYVHGRRDLIERGYDDDKNKNYYKVYFDEED
jgi:hypothetical protein